MEPIAWSITGSPWTPRVLFGCTTGVCAKTEVVAPKKQSRKLAVSGIYKSIFTGLNG